MRILEKNERINKSRSSMFLIALMVSSLVSFGAVHFGTAQSGTQVGGILWDNTTWTAADSPYIISSTVQIPSNVTLTIEAGVTVEASQLLSNMFLPAGKVIAFGSPNNLITFDGGGGADFFNQYSLTGTNNNASVDLNYCIIENGGAIWYSSNSIAGCFNLTNSLVYNTKGVPYLAPNSVTGEHYTENISYNVFANSQGFYDVSLAYTNLTVGNNLFVNDVGPLFDCATIYDSSFEVHNNSFLNITGPVLKLWPGASGSFIDGIENYWGTTNSTIVASMIYDETVDVTCAGFIPYLPILTSPDPSTPTCVIASAGAGGSISPSGVVSVNYGGSQSFTITPNAGYHVTEVYVNGTSVGAVSSYAVQNIQGASTVSVTFATNTPTATPTPSPTPSPMVTPTAKPTPTSPTATPTLTPTQTPIATFSPSPTISFSPTLPSPNSPRLNDISSENKSFEAKIKEIAEIVVAALVVGWVAVATVFARRRSAKISINRQVHLVELCKCLQAVAVSLLAGRFLTCLK